MEKEVGGCRRFCGDGKDGGFAAMSDDGIPRIASLPLEGKVPRRGG